SYAYLFNSYYVAAGPRHARAERGLLTRPGCDEIAAFRTHVDAAVERLLHSATDSELAEIVRILAIGLHHEQQHQELLLTDILHAFAHNPNVPVYQDGWRLQQESSVSDEFVRVPCGMQTIGFAGEGYCFDNEKPAHQVFVQPARIARGLVRNAQWLEFMADGGYDTPALWLSDGWARGEAEGWQTPSYWRDIDRRWHTRTPAGPL